jgi:glycosyltransferase involved in cell wall biosynthesis
MRTHNGTTTPLKLALLAPPWIAVPPPGYGGIESVIADIADGLVRRGHDVTLLAPPGSRSSARLITLLDESHDDEIGETIHEVDHVSRALDVLEAAAAAGAPFDIVHDHSGFTVFAVADRLPAPVLHTLHGPFDDATVAFYGRHADKAWVSALSQSQIADGPPNLRCAGVVPNPIEVDAWPFVADKDDYLLWIGRMSPDKGAHRAIAAARDAGRPVVLAGPVQPGQQEYFDEHVAPHIDGERVRYVEEVGGERKQELYAHAAALLMPIRWREPFGMVMIEAMACGTPVIAFPEGAAPEVVVDGECGLLVDDEAEMAAAVGRLPEIDPERCRASVAERFAVDTVAAAYERAYRKVIAARVPPAVRAAPRVDSRKRAV